MKTEMNGHLRDGFLFVGNQLALDFLNTRPAMGGQPVELLPDGGALAKWLAAAGLITRPQTATLKRRWSGPEFTAALQEFREFRESLRKIVIQIEGGGSPSAGFVNDLNRLLLDHPYVDQIVKRNAVLERRKRFDPELPQDVFAPLADATADLLTSADRARIRKCRSCVLHFYDTSKKGTRLWCSMSLCGNRSKVAAYARRRHAAAGPVVNPRSPSH